MPSYLLSVKYSFFIFHDWVRHVLLEIHKSVQYFTGFAHLNGKFSILKHVDEVYSPKD